MFIGEALCLVAFVIKKVRVDGPTSLGAEIHQPILPAARFAHRCFAHRCFANSIYFSIPAMLDMTGTGVMNAGLCLTYASVFQMLRSAVVVFTAFMSVAILKRKLRAFHWASIALVVAGVSVVGYVSIKYSGDDSTKSQSSVMLGNALVIVAQAMVALQMVVEEKVRARAAAQFSNLFLEKRDSQKWNSHPLTDTNPNFPADYQLPRRSCSQGCRI